ncbi:hypothetical protein GCM10011319_50680 [Mameliella alba]|nr:hypothetical protein GCM10011319_50680 [Mameliella alba]
MSRQVAQPVMRLCAAAVTPVFPPEGGGIARRPRTGDHVHELTSGPDNVIHSRCGRKPRRSGKKTVRLITGPKAATVPPRGETGDCRTAGPSRAEDVPGDNPARGQMAWHTTVTGTRRRFSGIKWRCG